MAVGWTDEERPPRVTGVLFVVTWGHGEVLARWALRRASRWLGLEVPAQHRPPALASLARSRAFPL